MRGLTQTWPFEQVLQRGELAFNAAFSSEQDSQVGGCQGGEEIQSTKSTI